MCVCDIYIYIVCTGHKPSAAFSKRLPNRRISKLWDQAKDYLALLSGKS